MSAEPPAVVPPAVVTALGQSVAAQRIEQLTIYQAPPQAEMSWPVLVGAIPGQASAFQDRPALRDRIGQARAAGNGVVLTQVLSGGGGVGKSQLAASYARHAVAEGTDLVVWADAAQPGAIAEAFARAGRSVGAVPPGSGDAEADAREFLGWAAVTSRSWLVVFDDIADPVQVAGWWPRSGRGTGWVLATTRRRDAALTGSGRLLVDVGVFTADEAAGYVTARLEAAGLSGLADASVPELLDELGHLPLALAHAAAYLINEKVSCASYLTRYQAGRERLDKLMPFSADADGYGRPVAVALLLALDAADQCEPAGLATRALRLAGMFDPAGCPAALWASEPVLTYLSQQRPRDKSTGSDSGTEAGEVSREQAQAVLALLDRYGCLTLTGDSGARGVRVHAVTGRAARETTAPGQAREIAKVAADALLTVWPDPDEVVPQFTAVLRANAITLVRNSGQALWNPDAHPVLIQTGNSLLRAGLHTAALSYCERIAADSERILGPEHPDTLTARANLAFSYWQAGRTAEAITIDEQVTADRERILGPEHPDTLRARANLASSYWQAGRTAEAITIDEQVTADSERILGPEHPDTLRARANLASSYWQAGRTAEAITIEEQVTADRERILGPEHPGTIATMAVLSDWRQGTKRRRTARSRRRWRSGR